MSENKVSTKKQDSLKQNLNQKGVVIPVIFAVVIVVLCVIFSSPRLGIFPSGNHDDSLTTTAPTQTTEYLINGLS